jgi:hypothetical protein
MNHDLLSGSAGEPGDLEETTTTDEIIPDNMNY